MDQQHKINGYIIKMLSGVEKNISIVIVFFFIIERSAFYSKKVFMLSTVQIPIRVIHNHPGTNLGGCGQSIQCRPATRIFIIQIFCPYNLAKYRFSSIKFGLIQIFFRNVGGFSLVIQICSLKY